METEDLNLTFVITYNNNLVYKHEEAHWISRVIALLTVQDMQNTSSHLNFGTSYNSVPTSSLRNRNSVSQYMLAITSYKIGKEYLRKLKSKIQRFIFHNFQFFLYLDLAVFGLKWNKKGGENRVGLILLIFSNFRKSKNRVHGQYLRAPC